MFRPEKIFSKPRCRWWPLTTEWVSSDGWIYPACWYGMTLILRHWLLFSPCIDNFTLSSLLAKAFVLIFLLPPGSFAHVTPSPAIHNLKVHRNQAVLAKTFMISTNVSVCRLWEETGIPWEKSHGQGETTQSVCVAVVGKTCDICCERAHLCPVHLHGKPDPSIFHTKLQNCTLMQKYP